LTDPTIVVASSAHAAAGGGKPRARLWHRPVSVAPRPAGYTA
jgi:hypothetical protein